MKISELIAHLQAAQTKFGDVRVFATWEGVTKDIDAIYGQAHGWTDGAEMILWLDVDDGFSLWPEHNPPDPANIVYREPDAGA